MVCLLNPDQPAFLRPTSGQLWLVFHGLCLGCLSQFFWCYPEANTFVRTEVCGIFEVFSICFKSGCLYKNQPLNFSQNYKLHQNTKVRLSYDQNLSYQSLLLLIFMPQSSIKSCFCVPQVPLCLFANFSIPHTRI